MSYRFGNQTDIDRAMTIEAEAFASAASIKRKA